MYESAMKRWPDQLALAIGLGNAAYAIGDKRRAVDVFRGAAEQHGSGAAWVNLAAVLMELGQKDDATAAARRALADPQWATQASELLARLEAGR
jgi:Flp pilus assembly protein TadD